MAAGAGQPGRVDESGVKNALQAPMGRSTDMGPTTRSACRPTRCSRASSTPGSRARSAAW